MCMHISRFPETADGRPSEMLVHMYVQSPGPFFTNRVQELSQTMYEYRPLEEGLGLSLGYEPVPSARVIIRSRRKKKKENKS